MGQALARSVDTLWVRTVTLCDNPARAGLLESPARGRRPQLNSLGFRSPGHGGALTALRYPERALVSAPSRQTYVESARPIGSRDWESSTRPRTVPVGRAAAGGASAG